MLSFVSYLRIDIEIKLPLLLSSSPIKSPEKVSKNLGNSEIIPQFLLQVHMKCTIQWPHCSKVCITAISFSVFCALVNRSEHYQCQNRQNTMLKKFLFSSIAKVFQVCHLNIFVWDYLKHSIGISSHIYLQCYFSKHQEHSEKHI